MKYFFMALMFCVVNEVIGQSKIGDAIHYASLNKAILLGQYDSVSSVSELKKYGDFGLGSVSKLDGELVILDGIFYSVPSDGRAKVLKGNAPIAYSAVKFFKADEILKISKAVNLKELEKFLDSVITENSFAAIKVTGSFAKAEYRSFHPQEKPYKPIEEASVEKFKEENLNGVMVGFYTPAAAEVLNSPVYHFHFIRQDKSSGGHLIDAELKSVKIEIDYSTGLDVNLPQPELVKGLDLNKK